MGRRRGNNEDPPSGADKIEDAFEGGGLISAEDVAWLGEIEYGTLLNFWVRGQPSIDEIGALVEITAGREGDFVNDLVERWNPPFKLHFLNEGSTVAVTWPGGQPSVESIPKKD